MGVYASEVNLMAHLAKADIHNHEAGQALAMQPLPTGRAK